MKKAEKYCCILMEGFRRAEGCCPTLRDDGIIYGCDDQYDYNRLFNGKWLRYPEDEKDERKNFKPLAVPPVAYCPWCGSSWHPELD